MDVQLVQENGDHTRKPLAILLHVQEETYLANVRNIIAEEVSDIMPPGKYHFCFGGTIVSKVMEKELRLKQILEKSDDASLHVAVLSIDLLDNEEGSQGEVGLKHGGTQSPSFVSSVFETGDVHDYESFQPTNSKSVATFDINSDTISQAENLQESSMQATSLPSVSLLPETPKNFKKVLQLRSPTTTEIRSLKIYTDIEIKRGKGQDQAYKIFWNERVRKMAKNRNISNKEIYRRTNEEWRLHRSKLLVNHAGKEDLVKDLVTPNNMQKTEDGPKAKKMKAATVPSNISRVKIASAKIENLQAEVNLKTEVLKKTVDSAARKDILTALSQLQTCLDTSCAELRRAQDALRKNLKKLELSKCMTDKETEKGTYIAF